MKKTILTLLLITFTSLTNAQCDIKTNYRQDGNTIKYFNLKPIVRQSEYEVGTSIYYNETTNTYFVNISILFKSLNPQKISENLILQLVGTESSIKLTLVESNLAQMNGRELSVGLFKVDNKSFALLKKHPLKGVYFKMNSKTYGSNVTENKTIYINEFKCF